MKNDGDLSRSQLSRLRALLFQSDDAFSRSRALQQQLRDLRDQRMAIELRFKKIELEYRSLHTLTETQRAIFEVGKELNNPQGHRTDFSRVERSELREELTDLQERLAMVHDTTAETERQAERARNESQETGRLLNALFEVIPGGAALKASLKNHDTRPVSYATGMANHTGLGVHTSG